MGIDTTTSQRSRTSLDNPAPSAPKTRQIGSRDKSPMSKMLLSAASCSPTIHTPASFSCRSAVGSPPTMHIGTYSTAPAADFAAVGVT